MKQEHHSNKIFYRIGEIASTLNVNASLLRYWEKEFHQFISPKRNKRGVRLYSEEEFEIFKQLHTLIKIQGLTLKGAGEKLRLQSKNVQTKNDVIRTLTSIREFLVELKTLINKDSSIS